MLNNIRNNRIPTLDTRPTLRLHRREHMIPTSGFLDKDTHLSATHQSIRVIHHSKGAIHPRSAEAIHLSTAEATRPRTREYTRHSKEDIRPKTKEDTRRKTKEDTRPRAKEDTHHKIAEDTRHKTTEDTRHRIKDIHRKTTVTHPKITEATHPREAHLPDTLFQYLTCTHLRATQEVDTHSNNNSNSVQCKTLARHSPHCQGHGQRTVEVN